MVDVCFYLFSSLLVGASLAVILARNPVHSVLWLIFAFFNAAGLFVLLGAEFIAMLLVIVYVGAVAVLFLFVVMMMNVTPDEQSKIFSVPRIKAAFINGGKLIGYLALFTVVTAGLLGVAVAFELYEQGTTLTPAVLLKGFTVSKWSILAPQPHILSYPILVISLAVGRLVAQRIVGGSFLGLISRWIDSIVAMIALGLSIMGIMIYLAGRYITSPVSDDLIATPIPPLDLMTNTHALGQIIYRDYIFAFQTAGLILLVAMIGAIVLTFRRREGLKRQDIQTQLARRPENTLVMNKVPLGQGVE
jgi:NADH:ubiquinone oxidoreductase subunit 6 (subunit J)